MRTRWMRLATWACLMVASMACQVLAVEPADRLLLAGDDFTARLPWFYHGLPLDGPREHDCYSFEVNGLELPPGDYTVVLVPKGKPANLAVGRDGRAFDEVPVSQGHAVLLKVSIRNRMLSFYVKSPGASEGGPLESVLVYPAGVSYAEAVRTAVAWRKYRRDTLVSKREILKKENWPEFHAILKRPGFGKKQLRAMFNEIVQWCKRRQVLDPKDIHYGAIYSEEDKYDFRDAAAASVCFAHAWRDTGEEDYRRRALLARDYVYKGQHMSDPANKAQYGGFAQMVHGRWGGGMQRLSADGKLPDVTGVETCILIHLLTKTFELGLTPSAKDLDRIEAAAGWVLNSELLPGNFRHHQGSTRDCQASNALAVCGLMRAHQALSENGRRAPDAWLAAARRGMRHYIEGQEAIGSFPYNFAGIKRGQAFSQQNLPDHGMGFYHFMVACSTPAAVDLPEARAAMKRIARWWLVTSRVDHREPLATIDLDDRGTAGALKFSAFTWCRFMAAASLARIAEATGEKELWRQLALRYMEHVRLKLWNTSDPQNQNQNQNQKAPVRRATRDDMTLCSWIQTAEWDGVLLREIEERLE